MRPTLHEDEIVSGLVLHMDPDDLHAHGAQSMSLLGGPGAVRGLHYFLCTGVDEVAHTSEWLPMFSRDGWLRLPIAGEHKRGHRAFSAGTSYVDLRQIWRAKNATIITAARRFDVTDSRSRCRVVPEVVDVLISGIEEALSLSAGSPK
jgi:hypothetical protein